MIRSTVECNSFRECLVEDNIHGSDDLSRAGDIELPTSLVICKSNVDATSSSGKSIHRMDLVHRRTKEDSKLGKIWFRSIPKLMWCRWTTSIMQISNGQYTENSASMHESKVKERPINPTMKHHCKSKSLQRLPSAFSNSILLLMFRSCLLWCYRIRLAP